MLYFSKNDNNRFAIIFSKIFEKQGNTDTDTELQTVVSFLCIGIIVMHRFLPGLLQKLKVTISATLPQQCQLCDMFMQACTGGGCRISEPTGARLFESSPTGIIPPVFSTTPFTIRVSWQPPLHSNGRRIGVQTFFSFC